MPPKITKKGVTAHRQDEYGGRQPALFRIFVPCTGLSQPSRRACDVACDAMSRRNGCPAPPASRGWRWRASRRYSGAAAAGEAAQDGHGQASPGGRGGSGHHNHGSSSEGCSTQDCSSRTSFQCCCSHGCNSTLQHHQQAEKGKGRQAETDEGRRSSRYAHLARRYHVHPRVGRADRDSLAAYAA